MDDDLETLCQSCGMCCDGTLFDLVPLERDEIDVARKHHLTVLANGRGAEQPCTALIASGEGDDARETCSIYAARPRACRRFACRVYVRQRDSGVPLVAGLAVIRRVRALFAQLDASGVASEDFEDLDALASRGPDGAEAARAYRELMARLADDFARA